MIHDSPRAEFISFGPTYCYKYGDCCENKEFWKELIHLLSLHYLKCSSKFEPVMQLLREDSQMDRQTKI
jgi:hypothetical protein